MADVSTWQMYSLSYHTGYWTGNTIYASLAHPTLSLISLYWDSIVQVWTLFPNWLIQILLKPPGYYWSTCTAVGRCSTRLVDIIALIPRSYCLSNWTQLITKLVVVGFSGIALTSIALVACFLLVLTACSVIVLSTTLFVALTPCYVIWLFL